MNVLSLFDGISCGRLALERAGVQVENYYAYEIEPSAISISKKNFPDIIQCGNVVGADFKQYNGKVELLIGGSPCQGFSTSGKGLNFEDSRSKLFFEFVRALKEVKPKYFLLENVKMKKEWQDIISDFLGVEPVVINSALVSAQNRVRLYWTNIPNVTQPVDKHIYLSDIIEDSVFEENNGAAIRGRYTYKGTIVGRRIKDGHRKDYDKSVKITQCLEVRKTDQKSNCLTTVFKDNVLTPLPYGRYEDAYGMESGKPLPFRYLTPVEYERLQTLPDNYTDGVSANQRRQAIGNAWTVDVIAHIFKGLNANT